MDYLIYLMSVLLEALEEELEGRGRGKNKMCMHVYKFVHTYMKQNYIHNYLGHNYCILSLSITHSLPS